MLAFVYSALKKIHKKYMFEIINTFLQKSEIQFAFFIMQVKWFIIKLFGIIDFMRQKLYFFPALIKMSVLASHYNIPMQGFQLS